MVTQELPKTIAVVGAGTMGQGIAQVAATAGHRVRLFDLAPGAAEAAVEAVVERVRARAARGGGTASPERLELLVAEDLADVADADVVVEAIVEDLDAKRKLFSALEAVVGEDCVLASNTSSLSPTALAAGLRHPERLVGLHFFNPVPAMRLVEVVPGLATAPAVADRVADLGRAWGKSVVRAAPTPGFVVNRVARPFYAEAWRLLEERAAPPATVDAVLTGAGGFRMGPFALMDLIGHDVNEAVTRHVWSAFGYDARFEPSLAQRALVEAGWLGRKSGRGVYDYRGDAVPPAVPAPLSPPPARVGERGDSGLRVLLRRAAVEVVGGTGTHDGVELPSGGILVRCDGMPATELSARVGAPVVVADRALDDEAAAVLSVAASDGCPAEVVEEAVGLLQAARLAVYVIEDTPGLVVTRTVAMLVNVAVDVLARGVAGAADIDTAMRLGTNYPIGPLAWGDRWGAAAVHGALVNLEAAYGDTRYRPSPLLARRARSGGALVGPDMGSSDRPAWPVDR